MSEEIRSMLIIPAVFFVFAAVSLVLTLLRPPRRLDASESDRLVLPLLVGIACQCVHCIEEFVTGLHIRLPALFGLAPLSDAFFVTVNLIWIAVWTVAAAGIRRNIRAAYFPVWFFALAMLANLMAHPLLALWTGGYFPGLFTSPLVGIMGIIIGKKLWDVTGGPDRGEAHG
jgi:hypothetical protein